MDPFIVLAADSRKSPRPFYVDGLPFEKVYASTQQQADYIADAMNKAYEAGRQARDREIASTP